MAVTWRSERIFAIMSVTLIPPNTGVNTPSFIAILRRLPPSRPQRPIVVAPLAGVAFHGDGADRRPRAAAPMALEHRVDDARGMIPVVEGGKRRRPRLGHVPAVGDERVDIAHHVAERIGPRFLMAARQVRIARGARHEQ